MLAGVRGIVQPSVQKNQRGQGLVEYSFILVLVALVVLMVLLALGQQVFNMLSNVVDELRSAGL